jgi:hypothetical protein
MVVNKEMLAKRHSHSMIINFKALQFKIGFYGQPSPENSKNQVNI